MENIEILILMACLCLPIWMGDVIDYAENAQELIDLLEKEEQEIYNCLRENGII
jgi:hypothetical protein